MNDTQSSPPESPKKIVRTQEGRMLAGVCSGFARHFEIDVNLVRVGWVLLTCLGGSGILAYIICWLILPEEEV